MHSSIRTRSAPVAALVWLAAACSGEPFRYEARARDAGTTISDEIAAPSTNSGVPVALEERALLARRGLSELVLTDVEDGHVLTSHVFEGLLLDVARTETGQLYAVELLPSFDAAVVHALSLRSDGLADEAVSDTFGPATRLLPVGATPWVMSEDMGTSWAILSPELHVVSEKLLFRPSDAFVSGDSVVALNPNLFGGEGDADALVRVSTDGKWQLVKSEFAAPGRPASRLVVGAPPGTAMVLRKQNHETSFELGRASTSDLVPEFASTPPIEGAEGVLESAVLEPESRFVVALLSRGADSGRLVVFGLDGAHGTTIQLKNQVESSSWPSRALLADGRGRLFIATAQGVIAFRVAALHDAPVLERVAGFAGAELAGPLTGTW